MFENVSINDVLTLVTTAAAVVGAVAALCGYIRKATAKVVKDVIGENVNPHLDNVHQHIKDLAQDVKDNHEKMVRVTDELDDKLTNMESCLKAEIVDGKMKNAKNYVVDFLADLDAGETPSQSQFESFYENLEVYESNGGNGFVHQWLDRLVSEGKFDSRQRNTLSVRTTKPKCYK